MKLVISEAEIDAALERVAAEINGDGKPVTFVVILKGAVCLIADLIRKLTIPFELTFITASSYGMRGKQPGELTIAGIEALDLQGKEVIVVDDICDTGATLTAVCKELDTLQPQGILSLVLLHKKREPPAPFNPDRVCFDIDDLFVVGYGLDYKEQHRGLRGIYAMES